jgi:hypothetical protein
MLALAAFLAVKLAPAHSGPPVDISFGGSEGHLARTELATALSKLFPKGNGRWQLVTPPAGADPGARCIEPSMPYRSSTGHAVTAAYLFARWLGVRLASFVYADAAAAERAFAAPGAYRAEVCRGMATAEELRRERYVVGKPRVLPITTVHIGDGGRSSRIVIPSRYKGKSYDWDVDTTSVRRGRLIIDVGTVVAEPFEQANQALARELVTAGV